MQCQFQLFIGYIHTYLFIHIHIHSHNHLSIYVSMYINIFVQQWNWKLLTSIARFNLANFDVTVIYIYTQTHMLRLNVLEMVEKETGNYVRIISVKWFAATSVFFFGKQIQHFCWFILKNKKNIYIEVYILVFFSIKFNGQLK